MAVLNNAGFPGYPLWGPVIQPHSSPTAAQPPFGDWTTATLEAPTGFAEETPPPTVPLLAVAVSYSVPKKCARAPPPLRDATPLRPGKKNLMQR